MQWIAVSNHNGHCVFLYKNDGCLNDYSDPVGSLRGVYCPHGVRFSSDGRFIVVADAGAPSEGGPKGIDIDRSGELLVTTCECQPLAFFDLADVFSEPTLSASETQWELTYELDLREKLREARRRAEAWEERALAAETSVTTWEALAMEAEHEVREARAQLSSIARSRSWRFTAPLRRLASLLRT